MNYLKLMERTTDVLAVRRQQLDVIQLEKAIQTVFMADAIKHDNIPVAQHHQRRYHYVLDILDLALGT